MKGSIVCCKLFLVIINIIYLILSVASIAVGIILIIAGPEMTAAQRYDVKGDKISIEYGRKSEFPCPSKSQSIGIALIVFGAVIFPLSLLAFCGSCCTNCCRMTLILFVVLLGLLMVAEIIMFSLIFIEDSPLHKKSTTDVLTKRRPNIAKRNVIPFHSACVWHLRYTCIDPVEDAFESAKPYIIIAFAVGLFFQSLQMLCALVIYKSKQPTENYQILSENAGPPIALVNQNTSHQVKAPQNDYNPITA
ncbi:hypothetical protein PoB_002329700 [Plakobranchus ocellatus]|uniref:Tetraspanin n=1 Tax=Plakobranchus ocellatus TaxID=259542 RepID=A0AAV3ZQ47_9GAST|nr:hypothetical protein PoB_002329700 [Plakobranchus ocellatus]